MNQTRVQGLAFKVGELSAASGVTVRTLHYYEEIGLLVPKRTEAGHRIYSAEDLERLDRKSTRLNSSHVAISYAVFCLKKKTTVDTHERIRAKNHKRHPRRHFCSPS